MTLQSFNIRGWKWLSAYMGCPNLIAYMCVCFMG